MPQIKCNPGHFVILNTAKFAGYGGWRFPLLEETMSLMEREKKNDGLRIDPVFDSKQEYVWTGNIQGI